MMQESLSISKRYANIATLLKSRQSQRKIIMDSTTRTRKTSSVINPHRAHPNLKKHEKLPTPLSPCLNAKRYKMHYFRDCEKTPEDQKKIILKKNGEVKKGQEDNRITRTGAPIAPFMTDSTTVGRGKIITVFMTKISSHSVSWRIYSGADDVAMSDSIVKCFNNKAIFILTIQFKIKRSLRQSMGEPLKVSRKQRFVLHWTHLHANICCKISLFSL